MNFTSLGIRIFVHKLLLLCRFSVVVFWEPSHNWREGRTISSLIGYLILRCLFIFLVSFYLACWHLKVHHVLVYQAFHVGWFIYLFFLFRGFGIWVFPCSSSITRYPNWRRCVLFEINELLWIEMKSCLMIYVSW